MAAPSARERFAALAELDDHEIDVVEAALTIAAEEYPDLDLAAQRDRIGALAGLAAVRLAGTHSHEERVRRLCSFLYDEQQFQGNHSEYYDPRNSFLNDVLERRIGIPITLALVYIAVGRPLGLDVRGVSFPGHFLVKCVDEASVVVDPFSGETLTLEECQHRLATAIGSPVALEPRLHLRSASAREILVRLLSNLKLVYARMSDAERALACCDRILLLLPDETSELLQRAQIYTGVGYLAAAAADLDRFLQLAPEDPNAPAVRDQLDALRSRVRLH